MKKILSLLICFIIAFSTAVFAAPEENAEKLLTDFFNNNKNELFPDTNGEIEVAFLADIDNDTVPELLVSAGAYFYGLSVYKIKDANVVKLPEAITFGRGTGINENYGFLLADDGHMYLYRDSYDAQVPWERNIVTQAVYDWSKNALTPIGFLCVTIPTDENAVDASYTTDPDGEQATIPFTDAEDKIANFKNSVAPYIVWTRDENSNYIDLETIWNRQKAMKETKIRISLQIGNSVIDINGVPKTLDKESTPIIRNNRTLVPAEIIEALGGTIQLNNSGNEITISCSENTIKLTADSNIAFLNGNAVTLDVIPQLANNKVMLPIRFIAESFGFGVEWEATNQKVTITK